jgi:hypothetical protein
MQTSFVHLDRSDVVPIAEAAGVSLDNLFPSGSTNALKRHTHCFCAANRVDPENRLPDRVLMSTHSPSDGYVPACLRACHARYHAGCNGGRNHHPLRNTPGCVELPKMSIKATRMMARCSADVPARPLRDRRHDDIKAYGRHSEAGECRPPRYSVGRRQNARVNVADHSTASDFNTEPCRSSREVQLLSEVGGDEHALLTPLHGDGWPVSSKACSSEVRAYHDPHAAGRCSVA